jgi:hypothetical protein
MFDSLPPPLPKEELPMRRGPHPTAVVSWVVVSLICLWLVLLSVRRGEHQTAGTAPTTQAVAEAKPATLDFQTRVSAQYAVGLKSISPNQSNSLAEQMAESAAQSTEAKIAMAFFLG